MSDLLCRTSTSTDATHEENPNDVLLLARLGYKQELKREFSTLELLGVSFTNIGVVPSMASLLSVAISNGGPVGIVWGWTVASIFVMFIAMAISELGSAAPTAGGLYYWTHRYASPGTRNLLSWIVGCITIIFKFLLLIPDWLFSDCNSMGFIAGTAAVTYGTAVQIAAVAMIGSDSMLTITSSQIFGLYVILLFLEALLASFGTRILARLQLLYMFANILLIIGLIASLIVTTPKEYWNTPSFAFGRFFNYYGWPDGLAFFLGMLYPLGTVAGFDTSVHISEEASNASLAVPIACIAASAAGCLFGLAINITLVFCMGTDLVDILENPIGHPLATILFNSTGKQASLFIFTLIIIVQIMTGTGVIIAGSRQIFAFARDGALPFSSSLSKINSSTQTPVNAIWFITAVGLFIGLLTFAGDRATSAFFSLGIVSQYTAYIIAIASRSFTKTAFVPGPFNLGRFSLPVAHISVGFLMFTLIIFLFPSTPTTNLMDMNYACAVYVGWLLLALGSYYFPKYGGVRWYTGPVSNIGSGYQ